MHFFSSKCQVEREGKRRGEGLLSSRAAEHDIFLLDPDSFLTGSGSFFLLDLDLFRLHPDKTLQND